MQCFLIRNVRTVFAPWQPCMRKTDMTTNKSKRPSLYATSFSPNDMTEVFEILGALESTDSRRKSLGWATLPLVAAAIGVIVLAMTKMLPAARGALGNEMIGSIAATSPITPPVVVSSNSVDAASETLPSAISVAAIITEEPAETMGAESVDGINAQAESFVGNSVPKGGAISAANAVVRDRVHIAARTVNKQPEIGKGQITPPAKSKANSKRMRPKSATRMTASNRKHAKPARHKDDRDVDLIEALLTRVSEADATEKSAVRAKPVKMSGVTVKRRTASFGDDTDLNRDIVVRHAKESIAPLVKRCRALGLVEGELCRIRICSGNWGKDPACPSADHPR